MEIKNEPPEMPYEYRKDLYTLFTKRKDNGKKNKYNIVAYNTGIIRQIKSNEPFTHLLLTDVCIFDILTKELLTNLDHIHIPISNSIRKQNIIMSCVGHYIDFLAHITIYTRINNTRDFSFNGLSKIKKFYKIYRKYTLHK